MLELPVGRYVMYLRKSRADEERERNGEFETLGKHERELSAMCRRMAVPVEMPPLRELVSGESIAAKPRFQELMEMVQARELAGVVVHAVDRLGRGDMMEYGYILSAFQFTRTLIVTPGKVYDPADPIDLQQLQLQMFFANTEITGIKRRMREGKDQAVRDGQFIAAHAPLGYDKVRDARGMKTLAPNEWAAWARRAFEWAADPAISMSEISRRLKAAGVPGQWDPARVKVLIRNPAYKGMVSWNVRVTKIKGRDGMTIEKCHAKGDEPILADGLHPAIVDDGLWDAANRRLKAGESHVKRSAPLRNPLAGILRCAKCGRAMVYAKSDPRRTGRCYEYVRHPLNRACTCPPAPLSLLVGLVSESLESSALECEVAAESGEDPAKALAVEREGVESAIAKASAKVERLVELYVSGGMDAPEYVERRRDMDARIAEMRARLDELAQERPEPPEAVAMRLKDIMRALRDDGVPPSDKNALLRAMVERIDYANDADGRGKPQVAITIHMRK